MFMNNFTKSDRSYWWSITNLTCCSSIKSLQSKSITALTLLMFLAFSSLSFAQVPGTDPTGGGEEFNEFNGSMYEVPARKPVSELMAPGYFDGFFDACHESDEDFVIHEVEANPGSDNPDNPGAFDGEWGVATGFAKGSTHCSWTFYYVYSVKCANEVTPFTVKYSGGDGTSPWVPRHLKAAYNDLIKDIKDQNVCYDDRPIAPTGEEVAEYYTDNSEYVKVHGVLVKKTTRVRNDDCGWIEIHTYTVSDYCPDNDFEFSITYSGADTEAPSFVGKVDELKPDITVDCDKIPPMTALLYTDNCAFDGQRRIMPVEDRSNLGEGCEGGYILRTYTIEDDCGNKDVHQYRIDVLPADKAYFEPQGPISVPCVNRNSFESYIPKLEVSNGMEGRCEISDIVTGVYDPADTDCGTFDVTYTFTDNCGRVTEKVVQVTIVDEEDPGITYASRDLTVECDGAGNLEEYNNWVATMGGATAQDNCTPTEELEWSNNAPELPNTNECGMTGSTTVIFIVKDLCGNQSKTYATFTIVDRLDPEITPAINQTVVCDGEGNVDQFENWLLNFGGATAKDDCSDVTYTHDFEPKFDKYLDMSQYLKGGCSDYTGYIDVVFTATDACGNSSSTIGTFTIEDSIAPYISDAEDKTVECDGNGNTAEYNAWINNNGGASLTQPDACSAVSWDHEVLGTYGDACDMYYKVKFTASDECGNESSTIAEFHIIDTLNPMIGLEAQDETFECNEEYLNDPERGGGPQNWEQAFQAWLDRNGDAQAMDICDDKLTWTNDADDPKNKWNELCGNTRYIIVTFVATDDCGHNSATTAEFRIVDTKAPYLEKLDDVRLTFDDKCEADTDPSNTGFPDSYDDCAGVTVTYADVTDKQDCVTTITRTWTSTDECDNSTQDVQVIRIYDETAPELTGSISQFNLSNYDACEAPAAPSEQDIADQFEDACGHVVANLISTNVISDDTCDWAVQFEYEVFDNCGNQYDGVVKVTYWGSDQTAPKLIDGESLPADVSGINACVEDALNDYPPVADHAIEKLFEDNCAKEVSAWSSRTIVDRSCKWEFYYTYYVMDDCQNIYEFKQHFSGEDNSAPVLVGEIPMDMSDIDACKDTAPDGPTEGEIAALFSESCGLTVDRTVFSTGDDCNWLYSYEYDVYDACGNHYPTFKITYQGGDQTKPVISCPDDVDFAYGDQVSFATSIPGEDIDDCSATTQDYVDSDHDHDLVSVTIPGSWRLRTTRSRYIGWPVYNTVTYSVWYDLGTPVGTMNGKPYYEGVAEFSTGTQYGNNLYRLFWTDHNDWHLEEKTSPSDPTWEYIMFSTVDSDTPPCSLSDWRLDFEPLPSNFKSVHCDNDKIIALKHTFTRTFTVTDSCDNATSCDTEYSYVTYLAGDEDPADSDLPDELLNGDYSDDVSNSRTEHAATTAVAPDSTVDIDFRAYPVPFNKDVNLSYNFKFDTDVTIEIYDTKGLMVQRQVNKGYRAGSDVTIPMTVNGADQLYYVKLITNQGTVTKKIVSSTNKR